MLYTEELMRRAAIYGSIMDSLVASILKYIPEEAQDKVVQEQLTIMHKSSYKAIASETAEASNLQLIRRDMALVQLHLQDEHIARARTAPFQGHSRTTGGPLPRNPMRRTRGGATKKSAGPSKGARQWRGFGGGLPCWFCPAMAELARRVQISKDLVVGCSVEVGMSPTTFDKEAPWHFQPGTRNKSYRRL